MAEIPAREGPAGPGGGAGAAEFVVPLEQKQPFLRRRRQRRIFAAHGLESAARKNSPLSCRHQKNLIFSNHYDISPASQARRSKVASLNGFGMMMCFWKEKPTKTYGGKA
ncbi:hypothetical protein DWUX_79 [Desulfovibrio diazotrophicus]|nr:hypothetical protein DWUX_79 [Desulfovibrio diazotrophicus]